MSCSEPETNWPRHTLSGPPPLAEPATGLMTAVPKIPSPWLTRKLTSPLVLSAVTRSMFPLASNLPATIEVGVVPAPVE